MKYINSLQNQRIKKLVSLQKRRHRERENIILVEGNREVYRALTSGMKIREMYICEDFFNNIHSVDTRNAYYLSKEPFLKISLRENPDGIIAIFDKPEKPNFDLKIKENFRALVLFGLEKPGNLGAILRTADCVNIDCCFIVGKSVDIYSPNVIRSSQGSVFHVKIICIEEDELQSFFEENQINCFACSPEAKQNYWQANFKDKIALFIGTEHDGLPERWRNYGTKIAIPMTGQADSLNASIAAALVLYESERQRM